MTNLEARQEYIDSILGSTGQDCLDIWTSITSGPSKLEMNEVIEVHAQVSQHLVTQVNAANLANDD